MTAETVTADAGVRGVEGAPLLQLKNVKMHFKTKGEGFLARSTKWVQAVDGVDLTVHAGETLGLVGESGCGKSTTARLITRLLEPTAGEIKYQGVDIAHMSERQLRPYRRRDQVPGRGHRAHVRAAAAAVPAGDPADLPGPVLVAEPAAHGRHDRRH